MSSRSWIVHRRPVRSAVAKRNCAILLVMVLTLVLSGASADAALRHRLFDAQIAALLQSDSNASTVLAGATSTGTCTNTAGAISCRQTFTGGEIFWSPPTGAAYLANGPLRNHWLAAGGVTGPYGPPTGPPKDLGGKGTSQDFTFGSLVYSPATGTQESRGAIRTRWLASGAERGPWGFPTAREYAVGQGRAQKYQSGTIYWSQSTGAHATTPGDIEDRYIHLGEAAGPLGFPLGEQVTNGLFRWQEFSNGYLILSPTTGTKMIDTGSYREWRENPGRFGWPVKDSWIDAHGVHTVFQQQETIWDPRTKELYSGITVDQDTAIIIGDSQLGGDSWTEQGARAAGFPKKIELGFGGWGYTRTTPATAGTPDSVLTTHQMLLPHGTPGAIFITLGGNDAAAHASDAAIIAHATETWTELRRLYPGTPIIVNGVMSTAAPNHANRRRVDHLITESAAAQGFTHVSVAGMAAAAGAYYKDKVHLTQAGHDLVAPIYAAALLQALDK